MNAEYFQAFLSVVEIDLIPEEYQCLVCVLLGLVNFTALFLHTGEFVVVMCEVCTLLDLLIVILLSLNQLIRKHKHVSLILYLALYPRAVMIIHQRLVLILT